MNIEDLSPCIDCKTKECGLIDGTECDKCRTFLNIKRIVENVESEEKRIMSLYDSIRQNTYTCDICKSIIFPEIITSGDNGYDVLTTYTQIRGGIGNAIIHGHVCDKCVKSAILKVR